MARFVDFCSGGKVELSSDGSFVACLYESDVSFVDVEEGVVSKRLRKEGSPGGEEEIVSRARPVTLLVPEIWCWP